MVLEARMAASRPPTRVATGASTPPDGLWADARRAFERWLDDDPAGLDDLVALMTPVLWHVVRAYRLPPEATEDVVQSTWLALVRRRTAITDPAAVGGWLTTTARREAWRVAKAGQHAIPAADDELAARLPSDRSAESTAVEADGRRRIWAAVDELPERCQRLLRVVAFERRPDYQSLASDLDMPIGSIGPTRGRCLAKLRVALVQAGEFS
jgi:RNA polymerase sigma factor (sigma-70 family)